MRSSQLTLRDESNTGTLAWLTGQLGPWPRFLLKRLVSLFVVLAMLLVLTFLLIYLVPGDPAIRKAGIDASAEQIEFERKALGLDQPVYVQFIRYIEGVARLDFGTSFITKQSVTEILQQRFPRTFQLAGTGLLIVMMVSVPLGILIGALTREGRNRRLEVVFMSVTSTSSAMPEFLTATFLAFIFAVTLNWLPVGTTQKSTAIILPAISVSLRPVASLARVVRLETLNVLAQDYIRTARSKRLPTYLIFMRHLLPNVLTAALTIGGLVFAGLLGGTVIVENVFAWPGLGQRVVDAVFNLDYPVIQGIVLYFGMIVVLINTAVDILLALVDPRTLVLSE